MTSCRQTAVHWTGGPCVRRLGLERPTLHGVLTMSEDVSVDNKTIVTLHICEGSPADGTWIPVDSSDDAPYSYKFTGGNHRRKNGKIEHTIDSHPKTVTIRLHPDIKKRYQFVRTVFAFDDEHQLTCDPIEHGRATFHNKCIKEMDAQYGVRVCDLERKNATLYCDPAIKNKYPQ